MSKIFYDHLIVLDEVEDEIKSTAETEEERHELWHIVDEIVHHRMLELILDNLDHDHHDDFLHRFHSAPHDQEHIHYLNDRIEGEIEEMIKKEVKKLKKEILKEIKASK